MKLYLAIFVTSLVICQSQCAKILGVFPMSSHSHFTVGFTLMKELADRGHDVTMLSPYPQKNSIKNYKDIDISSTIQPFIKEFKVHFEKIEDMYFVKYIPFFYSMGYLLVNETFSHPEVKKLMNSNQKFDLVIMEQFFNEAMLYFPYHLQAPLLMVSSVGPSMYTNHYNANPAPYSYVPYLFTSSGSKMTFLQRTKNIILNLFDELWRYTVVFPEHNKILHKYYPDAPELNELMKQVNVILFNSHSSVNEPFPLTPNSVEIGGYHVKPKGKLPNDIQEFLDNANEGVVYFCLGSNLKPSEFSGDKIEMFVNVLAKLKQKVLWKFELDTLPNQPKNVKLVKWAPQQDILAHKNVKLFISHGGNLGTIEAVYFGVPIVGIPFFGDQKMNMETLVRKGLAINVPLSEINEEKLYNAVQEVLNNKQYSETAKASSRAMHDRIVKPIDEAVFWVEYVMRNPDSKHFKSVAVELSWLKYHSLDVAAVFVLLCLFIKEIFKRLLTKKNTKINNKNKKKQN